MSGGLQLSYVAAFGSEHLAKVVSVLMLKLTPPPCMRSAADESSGYGLRKRNPPPPPFPPPTQEAQGLGRHRQGVKLLHSPMPLKLLRWWWAWRLRRLLLLLLLLLLQGGHADVERRRPGGHLLQRSSVRTASVWYVFCAAMLRTS